MRELGGSASIAEQEDKVAALLNLSEGEVSEIHRGNRTKLSYRLAWARNYLKRVGLLENSARGVWALTAKGSATEVKGSVTGANRTMAMAYSIVFPFRVLLLASTPCRKQQYLPLRAGQTTDLEVTRR